MQRRHIRRAPEGGGSYCVSCKRLSPDESFLIDVEELGWGKLASLKEGADVSMDVGGLTETTAANESDVTGSLRMSISPLQVFSETPEADALYLFSKEYTIQVNEPTTVPAKRGRSPSVRSSHDNQEDQLAQKPIAALPLRGSSFTFRQELPRKGANTIESESVSHSDHQGDGLEERPESGDENKYGGILNTVLGLVSGLSPRTRRKKPRVRSLRNDNPNTPEPYSKRRKPNTGLAPTAPYSPPKGSSDRTDDIMESQNDVPSEPQAQQPPPANDESLQRDGDSSARVTSDDEKEVEEATAASTAPTEERASRRAAQFRPEPLQRTRVADTSATSPKRIKAPKVPTSFSTSVPLPDIPSSPSEEESDPKPKEPSQEAQGSTSPRKDGIFSWGLGLLSMNGSAERRTSPELQSGRSKPSPESRQRKRDSPEGSFGPREAAVTATRSSHSSSSKPSGSGRNNKDWLENARSTSVIRRVPSYSKNNGKKRMETQHSDTGFSADGSDDEFSDDMDRNKMIAGIISAAQKIDALNGTLSSRSSSLRQKDKGKGKAFA